MEFIIFLVISINVINYIKRFLLLFWFLIHCKILIFFSFWKLLRSSLYHFLKYYDDMLKLMGLKKHQLIMLDIRKFSPVLRFLSHLVRIGLCCYFFYKFFICTLSEFPVLRIRTPAVIQFFFTYFSTIFHLSILGIYWDSVLVPLLLLKIFFYFISCSVNGLWYINSS